MITSYKISTNIEDMDFSVIYDFISSSYWAKNIPAETLKTAIQNSICFGVLTNSNKQVGFARVITDKATYAYLADVFIVENHRGKGLSKLLINSIATNPSLQHLRRFVLVTKDAHNLYEQFGFKGLTCSDMYMEIFNPDIYITPSL